MNYKEILAELKKLGTDQNVKIYKRHGAGENLYGVSFANLKTLKKKIKTNNDLARKLWNSKKRRCANACNNDHRSITSG